MTQSRRQREQARKALRASVSACLKRTSRSQGWRFSQGWLFREYNGWFAEVRCNPWIAEDRTTVEFRAKPMTLDPVFWEIVKTPDNMKQPLSFRLFGAWTCQGPPWSETEISEEGESEHIATRVLNWAGAQLADPPIPFVLSSLIIFLENYPVRHQWSGGCFAQLITSLALARRLQDVRVMCVEAIKRGEVGGFQIGKFTLPELVLDWLTAQESLDEFENNFDPSIH